MTTAALITMIVVQLSVTIISTIFIAKVLRINKSGDQQKNSKN